METILDHDSPLAAYLEGNGQLDHSSATDPPHTSDPHSPTTTFAPPSTLPAYSAFVRNLPSLTAPAHQAPSTSLGRVHHAWSKALNSRLGRADNARFIEHFRYIIVASQLLNEYVDHGAFPSSVTPSQQSLDGAADAPPAPTITTSLYGALLTAVLAFALVYLLHWARTSRNGSLRKGRIVLGLLVVLVVALLGYAYIRRQWLKFLRRNAVAEATSLTTHWQCFEASTASALSLIQEVELVSRGYRISTPLPPASRIDDSTTHRRCVRLRHALHASYTAVTASCVDAASTLRTLVEDDDLEKYFEVYDISHADAREAIELELVPDQDPCPVDRESLKHLRVLSYRTNVLRRILLCSLMALEADGGKPDFPRWRTATDLMRTTALTVSQSTQRIQQCLKDMESLSTSPNPAKPNPSNSAAKDRFRGQVRKISLLSSGIKTLQAKMQILREESNRSISQSDDPSDLGPNLMQQYDSIGEDLKELMRAWETGKASLQSNLLHKQECRLSLASSVGARSTTSSSIGGLTAVDEDGSPAAALKALTGVNGGGGGTDSQSSNRSSIAAPSSDEEVFEAVALPRQRGSLLPLLTREERMAKMHEERERQASLRAKRDANTNMLRELESVIQLRPSSTKRGNAPTRVTSI